MQRSPSADSAAGSWSTKSRPPTSSSVPSDAGVSNITDEEEDDLLTSSEDEDDAGMRTFLRFSVLFLNRFQLVLS